MLKVVKIVEGGIDLETGTELPRALVVSNGYREVQIPANDIVIREVAKLYAENGEQAPLQPEEVVRHVKQAPSAPRPIVSPPVTMGNPNPFEPAPEPRPGPQPGPEPEPEPVFDDEGFEPGEEFDDGGTGASSL